ncbi:hypothetical protein [Micromonospora sp. NPDC049891]|uniref:hypothetical protein n=1 Tax=Micromonospora sp. NPDC049891 TaxID=3155655 RepID=UPI0033DE5FAD
MPEPLVVVGAGTLAQRPCHWDRRQDGACRLVRASVLAGVGEVAGGSRAGSGESSHRPGPAARGVAGPAAHTDTGPDIDER